MPTAMPHENVATVEWLMRSIDQLETVLNLLDEISRAQEAYDHGHAEMLKDQLTSMPGYPLHQPGDRIILILPQKVTTVITKGVN